MSDKATWAERRQRLNRCKRHGLTYDPTLTSGCALCRKEGLLQRRSSPQIAVLLLLLLGLAMVAYQLFGRKDSAPDTPVAVAPTATAPAAAPAAGRLDPTPLRQPIQAFETALFERPADVSGTLGGELGTTAANLSRALHALPAAASAVEAFDRLQTWLVERPELRLDDLQTLRGDWLRFRSRHLELAPWFHQVGSAGAGQDPAVIAVYRGVASDLVALVDDSADALAAPEAWPEQSGRLAERLDELSGRLPARPSSNAPAALLTAVQGLEQALRDLRALVTAPAPPPGGAAITLAAIADTAATAQRDFDDLLL